MRAHADTPGFLRYAPLLLLLLLMGLTATVAMAGSSPGKAGTQAQPVDQKPPAAGTSKPWADTLCLTQPGVLTTSDPTFHRPRAFGQGNPCMPSTLGLATHYDFYEYQLSAASAITASTCTVDGGFTSFDSYVDIYQAPGGSRLLPFVPDQCVNAIAADHDTCGTASEVVAHLVPGYFYVVVTQYSINAGDCRGGNCYGDYVLAVRGDPVCPVPGSQGTPTPGPTGSVTPAPTGTPGPCPMNFSDVTASDWFYPYVQCLYCKGAISGYADGTFRPNNNTTRGQMTKIVVLGFAIPTVTPSGTPTFNDVPADNPFYTFIETAAADQIVSGYNCGGPGEPCPGLYYRPNNFITRGQLSKIVVVAAMQTYEWSLINPGTPTFSDVPADSPFYTYIETAVCHQVISGYADGTFKPGNNATRAQISKIVCIAVDNPASVCAVGSPTATPTGVSTATATATATATP